MNKNNSSIKTEEKFKIYYAMDRVGYGLAHRMRTARGYIQRIDCVMGFKSLSACMVASVALMFALSGTAFAGDPAGVPASDLVGVPAVQPSEAKLTKVIDAPLDTDASNDTYTFHFAGGGMATVDPADSSKVVSDGVQQDKTITVGNIVPVIDDVTLKGRNVTDANSVGSGTFRQTTVQTTLAYILGLDNSDGGKPYDGAPDRNLISFQHAGVYTYVVTESVAHSEIVGEYVIKSKASYKLRIYVMSGTSPTIEYLTVEKISHDEGTDTNPPVKVDSTTPVTDEQGRITQDGVPIASPAGDFRGREVNGFTFANEYVKGGHFIVENKIEGAFANRNKLFPTTLTIEDSAAPQGSCLTYTVQGGEDATLDSMQIDGRNDLTETCVEFKGNGAPLRIQARLHDGGRIVITGLYGVKQGAPVDAAGNTRNKLADGPNQGSMYSVSEIFEDDDPYRVRGSVFGTASVQVDDSGGVVSEPVMTVEGNTTGLAIGNPKQLTLGTSGEYVLVVNSLDVQDVSPTGLVSRHLPRILLIGLPVAMLVAWIAFRYLRKKREASGRL